MTMPLTLYAIADGDTGYLLNQVISSVEGNLDLGDELGG